MVIILESTKLIFKIIYPLFIRMCISILSISNPLMEMRSGNVQLDKTYCL